MSFDPFISGTEKDGLIKPKKGVGCSYCRSEDGRLKPSSRAVTKHEKTVIGD